MGRNPGDRPNTGAHARLAAKGPWAVCCPWERRWAEASPLLFGRRRYLELNSESTCLPLYSRHPVSARVPSACLSPTGFGPPYFVTHDGCLLAPGSNFDDWKAGASSNVDTFLSSSYPPPVLLLSSCPAPALHIHAIAAPQLPQPHPSFLSEKQGNYLRACRDGRCCVASSPSRLPPRFPTIDPVAINDGLVVGGFPAVRTKATWNSPGMGP
jgi:hypothetical protein